MSGWIKVEKDLATDPRVLRMASRLRHVDVTLGSRSRLVIVGALVTLWWYADTHIREDDTLPVGVDQINELVGIDGFCDLMPPEWFQVIDADSVKLVDYTVHNGTTAKKRAVNQKRQERCRNANADVTPVSRSRHADSVTRPREDQDQEHTTAKRRACRVPEPFEITPEMREWAQRSTPNVNLEKATEEFVDYWRGVSGKSGVKIDWIGTWRNRIRQLEERAPRVNGSQHSKKSEWM